MTNHDAAMLDFVLKWRHWGGGPDEDIFVDFGLTPATFFRRVRGLLSSPRHAHLGPQVVADLVEICERRAAPVTRTRRSRRTIEADEVA